MADDLLRRMRDHVGYDPERIVSGQQSANRAERRAAKRVVAERTARDNARLLADLQEPGYPDATAITYCTTPGCDYTIRGYWGDTIAHHDDGTHTVAAWDGYPQETKQEEKQ